FFTPVLRSLTDCARIVVLGTPPEDAEEAGRAIAQRALEGVTRSLGKEVGHGGTVQLVYVADGAQRAIGSTLAFLLSDRSAYVSGQVIRIGANQTAEGVGEIDPGRPLQDKVALITGASRGLGAAMASTLHRDGATIVGVDVPAAASELKAVMDQIDG